MFKAGLYRAQDVDASGTCVIAGEQHLNDQSQGEAWIANLNFANPPAEGFKREVVLVPDEEPVKSSQPIGMDTKFEVDETGNVPLSQVLAFERLRFVEENKTRAVTEAQFLEYVAGFTPVATRKELK